ncbi:MAG: hypothetical protein PHX40_04500 [Bacilli bacterium]|nr:hypothetical protein [Tissierellia bacterium]MDD4624611.1 hypothetical protein [Bacilli bacterium]
MALEKSERKKDNYNFIDLRGQQFGKLKVLENEDYITKSGHTYFLCQCECNSEPKYVESYNLKSGHTQSCGCLRYENKTITHGLTNTRLYRIYHLMKKRCYKKENNDDYKNYGGRGITICDEWLNKENGFINFYNWAMVNGYQENLTIDRKDNDGNYEPDNCRWVTIKTQSNNRRSNNLITIDGVTKNITQWAEEYDLCYSTIKSRLNRGKTGKDLVAPARVVNFRFKYNKGEI